MGEAFSPATCCAPLSAPLLSETDAGTTAAVFKALSDPHRVRILNLLSNSNESVCVCDITESLGLSQPTTSFHLKKLAQAGLLAREQRGTWAYYSLNRGVLARMQDVFQPKETVS